MSENLTDSGKTPPVARAPGFGNLKPLQIALVAAMLLGALVAGVATTLLLVR